MLNEILKDHILNTKLVYLNGFLSSLAITNSYSIIGMQYKLFSYNFSEGNIEKSIQDNSYELFGVYPNEWSIEIIKTDDWKKKLKNEFYKPLTNNTFLENESSTDLKDRIKESINYFIGLLENEFICEPIDVYEMKIIKGSFYRIIGIDLIFEIDDTKILLLQILGSD